MNDIKSIIDSLIREELQIIIKKHGTECKENFEETDDPVEEAKKKKKKRKKKRKPRKSSRSKYFGAGYYPMHAGFYGDIASNAAGIGDGGGDGGGGE